MKGTHQLTRQTVIGASRELVWAVIADSRLLPAWAPPVKAIDEISGEVGYEGVGTTRRCRVVFAGRPGMMTERCVDFQPQVRAGYVVDEDSLGFSRMFADYGFTITVEDGPDGSSVARTDTYYTPRNLLFRVINATVMRRRFARTVDELLAGLKRISEDDEIVVQAGALADDPPLEQLRR
jgi:Polyketide cyclase / dehydrase and lipid transport